MEAHSSVPQEILNRKRNTPEDLKTVGPYKPLGFLHFSHLQEPYEAVTNELKGKGLECWIVEYQKDPNQPDWDSRFFYAFDRDALSNLLKEKKVILDSNNWPSDPDGFVTAVATKTAPTLTPLFDVIADSFADYDNPARNRVSRLSKWYQAFSPHNLTKNFARLYFAMQRLKMPDQPATITKL